MEDEINTLDELIRAISDVKTAGYFVDIDIRPREEKYRAGTDAFWLVVVVSTNYPNSTLEGDWWFDADSRVVQVL